MGSNSVKAYTLFSTPCGQMSRDFSTLHQPLPNRRSIHPSVHQIHTLTVLWARLMGITPLDQHIQRLKGSLIGHFVARVFPTTGNMAVLQLAADWITLFCCLDDRIESMEGIEVEEYLKQLLRVFRDGESTAVGDPFAMGFRDLRERMLKWHKPKLMDRFSSRMESLFHAFVKESAFRTPGFKLDVNSYLRNREETVGIKTGFILGELINEIVLSAEVLEHQSIRLLESVACKLVGMANDIFTAEKEFSEGEVNNLVMVMMQQEGLSFEEALKGAEELHDAEMTRFLNLLGTVPSFGHAIDPQICRYLDLLQAFVWAHIDWAKSTGRYCTKRLKPANGPTC